MTTATWGHLLALGPIYAVAAATGSRGGAGAALAADADARALCAEAAREARLALAASAATVRRASVADARARERADAAAGASYHAKRSRHAERSLWSPRLASACRNAALFLHRWRGLEAALLAPRPLWALASSRGLGLAADGAKAPSAIDRAAGRAGAVATGLDALVDACGRADAPCPTLRALRAALDAPAPPTAAAILDDAGRPRAARADARGLLRKCLLALAALPALLVLLELALPSRGRQFREIARGPGDDL